MTETPLEQLLARNDPICAALARDVDRLIMAAAPQLVPRLAYSTTWCARPWPATRTTRRSARQDEHGR